MAAVVIELTDDEQRIAGEALRLFIGICQINARAAGGSERVDAVYVCAQNFMADTAQQLRQRIRGGQS